MFTFAKRISVIILIVCVVPCVARADYGNAGQLRSVEHVLGLASVSSRLSGEIQISLPTSPECDRSKPSVAYSWAHDEYLVVWDNTWPNGHHDIYARRVSAGGQLLSWFSISAGPNSRTLPAVAYNGATDEYLVVWMYNANGDGATFEIWGRTIAWNGAYLESEFQIITWPNRSFQAPRVAWNNFRNEYLVVWSAYDATTLKPTDIAHAIFDANGNKLFGAIITTAEEPHQADVTYNKATDEYLVVWRRMWTSTDGDIYAARIGGGSGVVVNPPGAFTVDAEFVDQSSPVVATNQQHRYIVLWQQLSSTQDWDIFGQELDVNGYLVGSKFTVAGSGVDETSPAIAAQGGAERDYLAVWEESSSGSTMLIRAVRWGDAGGERFLAAASASLEYAAPVVAWGKQNLLIAYDADSPSDPTVYQHIYGRLYWPDVLYLPLVVREP